jgi:IMP-specific 5'-nucleotidase
MKEMLMHSFVLDCLESTGADTFEHFETLIEEHRTLEAEGSDRPSRLKQLVPTVGTFKTPLPLRQAFTLYNEKHHLTKRKHVSRLELSMILACSF